MQRGPGVKMYVLYDLVITFFDDFVFSIPEESPWYWCDVSGSAVYGQASDAGGYMQALGRSVL